MSIISDSMLRNNDNDRASAQYASSQPYSQTYSDEGSSNDNQQGLLERIFNGLGAASDWISNNVEYVENSPAGQWIGNKVEYVENSPVGQAVSQTLGQALAPANSIFQNWPALLGLAANAAVTPQDNDTFSGSLYDAGVNGAANTVGNIADLMHKDDLAAAMYALANKTQDNAPVQADWDWNYITNPHGLTRSFGNAIGSMAPLLPAAALAPESLVAAAGRLSPWLANGVRYGFTAIPEAMAEGGQTRREAIEEGLDHPDLRAFGTVAKNLPLLAVSNTLEGAILGGGLGKMLAGKAGESVLSRMAKAPFRATPSALAEGLQNGLEEGLQQGIQNASVDKEYGYLPWNWTDDQWDAAKEGFFGTLPLGGIGGARKAIFPGVGDVAAAPENGPDNTDPVAMAQLTGKNDDVPTADGVDVTELDPQQYTQWYGDKLKAQGIDVPDATLTVQTPQVKQAAGTSNNAKSGAPSYDASALEGDPQYTVSGEVSSTDVTPLTDQKMRLLDSEYYNKYGQHLYITSMKRNGDGSSWHDSGQAFDTADDNLENNKEARDWLVSEGEKLGLTPLDEYENPSAHATGGHIHFSDHGDPIPGNTTVQNETAQSANSAPAADLSSLPVGDIATAIAQNTGLPANFIWAQLSHESDGGNSKLAREDHNYGGVKGTDGEYLHFDNDQQFIDYMSNYYPKYREDGIYDAQTADQFAEALQHGGYFTADLGEYEGGMHRYLEQAGLSDSGTAGAPAEKQSTVNTMTQQQFGDMLNEKMIDFAGTNDDTVKTVFNDMSTSKDKALVSLFAPYMQDGVFANTAANRTALVNNDGFKKAMAMFLSKHLSDYAPAFENGKISFQQAEEALRPRHQVQAAQTAQAPNIQTAASPKMEADAIQNVLSSFAQDKKNVARTEQEANLFDDMLDADDHFIDTPKNRQTLLKNYGAQLQNYVDDVMTPSLDDRVNQAIEQAVQNKDLNRMNILTQAKQANDTATLEKLVGPQTKQHVDIAAMLTPANTDVKNHVSSMMQGNAPVHQTATMEHQAPQNEVASTVQGNTPVQQAPATENEMPQGKVASTVEATFPAKQAPVRMNNQRTEQQTAPEKQSNVTPLPTQETQQSEGVRIAQPQPTIDEQNAQMDARIAAIKKQPLAQRKALGQQYLDTLRQNNVSFSEKKLAKSLMNGDPKALEHVQRTYGDLLNTITPAEAAAASQQTTPRTVHAIRAARLNGMMNEIAKGSTFKNASTMQKLAYLMTANSHAGMLRDQGKLDTIHNTIDKVRADAGLPGSGLTDGMTKEQRDSLYYETIKQQLDDEVAIRKEATDEDSDSLRGIDNDIKLLMRELADSRQKVKAARKENTNESTQSESQRTQDEGTKNQDQHTKPEPRKAADTQREAEEGEVSATKKAANEGGSVVVTGKEQKEGTKNLDTGKVPGGLSKEAQGVYIAVRDKLRTSKSERARRAADVSAEILARHADTYAKAYSKATGKKYTAADYMRDKIGIDTDGNVVNDEKAKQFFQKAWHGSPHDFDRFDLGAIGTGEGAQVHGWGLYFAANREVSEGYIERLSDVIGHEIAKDGSIVQKSDEEWVTIDNAPIDENTPPLVIALKLLREVRAKGNYNIGDAIQKLQWQYIQRIEDDIVASDFLTKWYKKFKYRNTLKNLKAAEQILKEGKYDFKNITSGNLFEVEIPEADTMLDEQLSYSEQPKMVQKAIDALYADRKKLAKEWKNLSAEDFKEIYHPSGEAWTYFMEWNRLRSLNWAFNAFTREDIGNFLRETSSKNHYPESKIREIENSEQAYNKARNDVRHALANTESYLSKMVERVGVSEDYYDMNGREIYQDYMNALMMYHNISRGLASKNTALALREHGVNGVSYVGGRDGRCYVTFDDKTVKIINKYNQMLNGAAQGYTSALSDGKRVVTLLDGADESTFLHEMGHVFLLDLQDLAEIDQTSANDMSAVESWATWKNGQAKDYKGTAWEQEFADREKTIVKAMADGDEATASQLKDEWMQERFARGFERYLESGEAPSSKLKSVFEKFKQFLTRIYNAFKGAGGKPSEDVKNVMARMLDSDVENTIKVPAMGEPIHGIKGTETTVVTDSGKEIRVRYLVVPASRVITSHDAETMVPNKAYPQELQPRDRQRVSMQEQVTTMANELRPADLGAGRNLNQGAPIIRKDGVVLNGNGRAMAIQKATAAGGDKATAYRKYIFEHSKEFGISRSNLSQMRKYMLVREVVDDIDAETMQDIIGSTAGGSRMGASEQAKADAKKIKPRDLERYVDNEQGDLTTAANQDFVAGILYRIVSKNERNAYTDEHGNVNADGIQRVKRALFSLAYDDDGLIDKMAESTDDNIRNVSRGLMNAAPAFARVNLAVADGQAYPYNADKTVSEAVKRLDALRNEGKPVKDYLNGQSMFSEYQDTDEMRDVLRFFDDNKRSGKKIGIFLNDIANSIMMQGDPNQTSLMDGGRATLGEIIKTSARVASNGTSSADLFADVQEAPTKAKENTTQAIDDILYSAKQNDAQAKRSLQAVVDEAKKAFPNAKNIRQDGGHISMDMPNGAEVQINVVPSIEVNNEEAGRARAAHGLKDDVRIKINGGERTVGRTALIELSQLGRKGTAYHEAFHAVYDMCLTNEEKAALHKAYDKEAKAKGRDVYEVMADKYRDWMLAQQKGQHTLFGKLWQKVKSAVIRLLHLIRGADNARDVFRKAGSGEVWERQLNSKDSGNRYLVTNDQIRPDIEVPIIDVTDEPKVNVNNHHAAADIARSMIGKTFRIIGSDGYGKIASVSDGTHFVHSSNNPVRFDKTRRKALSVAEKILGNCVYIEKHGDLKHGTKQSYIEMFSVVKDGNRLVRFRIVAKEGNKDSHAFRIGEAKFYDIIKDGALQESGVLRHYKHEGAPSTLTIAELLKGVKDREGHLYVNKDGSLNYDTRIFHNGEEQGGSPSDVRNSADLFAIRPGEPIRYSLDANDNSKPSLFTRAYNHLTGRKNAASHDKNVKAMLEDITKMRIRFGKLDPKTETVFKKFEGVIRARNANEWEKVLPEAGRAIADRLNLKPSEDMNNYIAKWLLDEATNDTSQEASDFAAALKNDPVLSDQLVDLKTLFNERNNREADEVVRDAIQYEKPKERTTLTKAWETFYDEMIEELGPVKRMVKRVQEKSGQELAASVNPYIALRLFRGNAGRAMTMIEGQSEAAVKALQTNYPGVNFNGFKTLHMILDECGALHNEKRMKDFLAFALACHVKDIHTLNNRIRKSQQRLRDKIADLNDKINNLPEYQQLIESDKKVDDKHQEQREAYQKEIEGYQAKIDKAEKTIMEVPRTEDGLSLTEDRCNKVMMKYMKEYGEAQQDLVHFSKVTTSILYDAGVISKKRYKELQERWPNYIPMFRVFEDNEEVDFGDSLKHMHGSTRRIINPLDSIIRNTYDFVKKAEKNKARQLLADLTRISDVGEYIEEVDNSKPNDKTTITFYENGERKYLQTDPDIVKAVNNMGREESNWVLRLLHGPAKIARACFTTINPSFALRNLIRDSTDATIYSKYGFKPWDFVRGFLHAVHRDELFYEWLSSGAAQASAISLDRDYTQATLNQMSKTWKERLLSKEFLPAILEGMQMVGEYSEYGTRIAAYERTKKKLAGENGPHPAAYDLASAALESRDLMDFARGGRGSRYLNNVVVFANASIQGFDKFFRTFDFRKPYRKESMKALARLFLCGMLPALLLAGIHSGDDWWEELPDWQKETNWILGKVGNTIIRIPKGQDIGLRFFSNLIEKAMDRSKHKAGDYFKPVWDSLPDMIPTALLPIIEATANHSYFTGAPVVPKYQEKLPAYLQFGNETSSFAKFVGKVIGVSPRKVEHVLFGYTGNMGKGLLGVYDTIVGNQSLNTNLNEAPVISGFTAIPYKQSKTVNDFYDKFDEQQRLNEEFKLTKKKPDGYDPSLYKRMTKAQQELSKINKQERAAIDDPKMDSGVREQKQLGYQQRRLSVVRKVMGQ